MFRFTKKDFTKFIKAPISVKPNKRSRFAGLSKEKITKIMNEPEEWSALTKKNKMKKNGFEMGVISYLEDIICDAPEEVFEGFIGMKLEKKRNQIRRDLVHWLREENMFFSLEDSLVFGVENLAPRSSGLTQILEEADIGDEEESLMNDAFIEDSCVEEEEEEWLPPPEEVEEAKEMEEVTEMEEATQMEAQAIEDLAEEQEVNNEPVRKWDGQPITDIFLRSGKLPSNGKGGENRTWSPKFINLSLEMLIKGETASSIHNFFKTTAKYYPELLGEEKRVPSPDWFERLRDSLKYLNEEHTKDVILKGKRFHLASDGAAMLDASKTISVGLINESGKLHLIGTELSIGGTSQIIADQMIAIIDKTGFRRIIGEKIDLLMSDQQSAQINANAIVAERLTREINKDAPPSLFCAMHCVSNCDKNSRVALKEVNEEAFTLLELVKSVFGKPEKFGYVQQDGRRSLQLLLKYDMESTRTKIFSHDLGKRFGNDCRNSGALVRHFPTVMNATKHMMTRSFEDSKFHQIHKLCSGRDNGVLLDAATLFLNYCANINHFHKKISKVNNEALSFLGLKDLFQSVIQRMKTIIDSEEPYSCLLEKAALMSSSEESKKTVELIEERFQRVSATRIKRLNTVAVAVVGGSLKKYEKDYGLLKDLDLPDDRKISCSNRAVESSFATLKGFEKSIQNLSHEKMYENGRAKFNKLNEWLDDLKPYEAEPKLLAAFKSQKTQREERKRRSQQEDQRQLALIPRKFKKSVIVPQ